MSILVQIVVQFRTYSSRYSSPEQPIDELGPLVVLLVVAIRVSSSTVGTRPDQVEIHPPAPLAIGRRLRRQQIMILPTLANRIVDQRTSGTEVVVFLPLRARAAAVLWLGLAAADSVRRLRAPSATACIQRTEPRRPPEDRAPPRPAADEHPHARVRAQLCSAARSAPPSNIAVPLRSKNRATLSTHSYFNPAPLKIASPVLEFVTTKGTRAGHTSNRIDSSILLPASY